jgi:hypothetical protein
MRKLFSLSVELFMYPYLLFIIIICKSVTPQGLLEGSKQMTIRRCKVWTVLWVVKSFKFDFVKGFLCMGSRMRAGVVLQKNTLQQPSCPFLCM